MNRSIYQIIQWILIVVVTGGLGSLGGWLLGYNLHRLSYDYIIIPAEHQDWGLRFGILVGTVLQACHGRGQSDIKQPWPMVWGLLCVGAITGLGILAGTAIAHTVYHQGWWDVSFWKLPNPSRHALLVGALTGRNYGSALGLGVGAIVAWKSGQHWR